MNFTKIGPNLVTALFIVVLVILIYVLIVENVRPEVCVGSNPAPIFGCSPTATPTAAPPATATPIVIDFSTRQGAVNTLNVGYTLRIACSSESKPYTYYDSSANPVCQGFEIDVILEIIRRIEQQHNITIARKFQPVTVFDRMNVVTPASVGQPTQADVSSGAISTNAQRCSSGLTICTTSPHMTDTAAILIDISIAPSSGNFATEGGFCRTLAISGRVIGVIVGTIAGQTPLPIYFNNCVNVVNVGASVRPYVNDRIFVMNEVNNGTIAAYFSDRRILCAYVNNYPNTKVVLMNWLGINTESYGFVFPKGYEGLRDLFNDEVKNMLQSGTASTNTITINSLIQKHKLLPNPAPSAPAC
jgi:hypothetical protein